MLALFCNAFLIRLSDFRHEITLEFAGPVFSRSPLLKATDAMFWRHTAFVCGGNPCSEGLSSHVQFLVSVPNLQAGVTPTQNEWTAKPGSFNSKIHVSTSLISSSLTQLGALYVQKGFFPTWRRSSTQPAQVSIVAVRFLHGRAFLSLHFSHYISCLYVGSFL